MRILPLLLLLAACGDDETDSTEGCESFPDEATAIDGPIGAAEDCGRWSLSADKHAYVNVEVSEPEAECTGTPGGVMSLANDPIYSNASNDEPKWTFDLVPSGPGEGSLDVTCVDGSTWGGRFVVE